MSYFNQVILLGRLTADPELTYTTNGNAVARFSLAVEEPQSKESRDAGEKPKVNFLDCVAWRSLAENLANYQKKGNLILVSGRLTKDSYKAQDGSKRYSTKVVADTIRFMPRGNGNKNKEKGGGDENPFLA